MLWNKLDERVVTNSSSNLIWMFGSCPSSPSGDGGCSAKGVGFMKVPANLVSVTGDSSLLKSMTTNAALRYNRWIFEAVLGAFGTLLLTA